MFFISGITGQVGGSAARVLISQGKVVRALIRNENKASEWAELGVDVRLGDMTDPDAVTDALQGVDAAFLMQPTPIGVTRDFPEAIALTSAIVAAVERASPPRLVILSSVGSEQSSGLGNITQTHMLEQAVGRFDCPVAVIRAGAFLENNLASLDRARESGVFDSFLQPIDGGFPMVASSDIGAEVARLLVGDWTGNRIIELGSRFTPNDLARAMGEVLGRAVEARPIPRGAWPGVLAKMGLSGERIENWAEMQDGFNSGWIDFGRSGTESVPATTSARTVFAAALDRKSA